MFKIIKQGEYRLLKKIAERQENYIVQIKMLTKKVDNHNEEITIIKNELKNKDKLIEDIKAKNRKNSCKSAGLQSSLNRQKEKNDLLVQLNGKLTKELKDKDNELKNKNLELNVKQNEMEVLKSKDKKTKNVETYKNYFESRRELEKRNKKC